MKIDKKVINLAKTLNIKLYSFRKLPWVKKTNKFYYEVTNGVYLPKKNKNVIYYNERTLEWLSFTVLHEIIHWTGTKNRLNRGTLSRYLNSSFSLENDNNKSISTEELTAEIGSVLLAKELKIPIKKYKQRCIEFCNQFPNGDVDKAKQQAYEAIKYIKEDLKGF